MHSNVRVVIPIEVRVPGYSSLRFTYGRRGEAETLIRTVDQLNAARSPNTVVETITLEQGVAGWSIAVACIGTESDFPGAGNGTTFSVDRVGNGFWHSENPAIASINSRGRVSARAVGTAYLVFTDYLGFTHRFEVVVQPRPRDDFSVPVLRYRIGSSGNFLDFGTDIATIDGQGRYVIDVRSDQVIQVALFHNNQANPTREVRIANTAFFTWSNRPDGAFIETTPAARNGAINLGGGGNTDIEFSVFPLQGVPHRLTLRVREVTPE
jgi:hypothetical protein